MSLDLLSISLNNVKHNKKNYFTYIVSIIINISIFNVYLNIANSEELRLFMTEDSLSVANILFNLCSYVIILFSVIFMWNSTSFFIRKRKKEIGIYALMGMKNKDIAKMMFIETLIIGLFSLIVSIIIGTILSQIFARIFMSFVKVKGDIGIIFSFKALKNTVINFTIVFVIISIRAYRIIYKFKLIDLFKGEKTNDKEPKNKSLKGILSIVMIISGYFFGSLAGIKIFGVVSLFLALILVIVGTYLCFDSFFALYITFIRKRENTCKNVEKLLSLSNIRSRIGSNAKSLAVISILNASIIVAASTTIIITGILEKEIYNNKFSYVYHSNKEADEVINKTLKEHENNRIKNDIYINSLRFNENEILENGKENKIIYVIKDSDYNNLCEAVNIGEKIELKGKNNIVLLDENRISEERMWKIDADKIKNVTVRKNINMILDGRKETFNLLEYREEIINPEVGGKTLVVTSEVFERMKAFGIPLRIRFINVENQNESKELTEDISNNLNGSVKISSYYKSYESVNNISGTFKFIALFTSFVFIISSLSVIYFKIVMECDEEIKRYSIMKKIGFSYKDMKKSMGRELAIIFTLPLAVSIIHSLVALSTIISLQVEGAIISIAIFMMVYLIFYKLSEESHFKFVIEKI
ncbi:MULTISPECIES: ABC transporter permease [Clostridium]|uniref:ABC transporter permease n=1 Tax=Clostridium faecium TaxID=2762223 RepID=A0ABR8YPB9_9CLOT|nr:MULTISPECIES: ABC transporter permease [Clostridium]MBD8046094.1 ABC transporter permease [Clostridium faecium]